VPTRTRQHQCTIIGVVRKMKEVSELSKNHLEDGIDGEEWGHDESYGDRQNNVLSTSHSGENSCHRVGW
jgi:hypothetical protein